MLTPADNALWFSSITADDPGDIEQTAITEGKGCWVRDGSGTWYLDARAAMWNTTLGYTAGRVIEAIHTQLGKLPVAQMIRYRQPAEVSLEYARRLTAALPAPLAHVRFGSTGSQMTAAAVLLSRFLRKVAGEAERVKVLAFTNGYHGTGGIAGALTGERQMHALQSPLAPEVHHVRPWDLGALRSAIARHTPDRITAVIAEPIMGTDVIAAPPGALQELRELCDEHGLHLIADEVTTGFGRTGALSVMAEHDVVPDMLILGKGITSGYFPLAALVTTGAVFQAAISRPGFVFPHGCTADGHPAAMAAGIAVLDELADGTILANVKALGHSLRERLRAEAPNCPLIHEVRGEGLMIGVELRAAGERLGAAVMAKVHQACAQVGLLITTTNNTVVLMPPLVLEASDADELASRLIAALAKVGQEGTR